MGATLKFQYEDSTVDYFKRYALSKLHDLSILCIEGEKICNSDGFSFYPDYIGLYDGSSKQLGFTPIDSRPLTCSIYIALNNRDVRDKIVPAQDPDLRWPTEIVIVFDPFNLTDLIGSQFYCYQGGTGKWRKRNVGIVKTHDQVGTFNILNEMMRRMSMDLFFGDSQKTKSDKLKNDFVTRCIREVCKYIYGKKKISALKFMEAIRVDSLKGFQIDELKKARMKYQSIKKRKDIYDRPNI